MTYKQIEASREIRLWIGQVIVPAAVAAVTVMSNPNVRDFVSTKFDGLKRNVKDKFERNGP